MRYQGKIVSWDYERGFGFVVRHDDSTKVFLHVRSLPRGAKRPVVGGVVTYALARDERGRSVAVDADYPTAMRTAQHPRPDTRRRRRSSSGLMTLLVLAGVAVATYIGVKEKPLPEPFAALRPARVAEPAPPAFTCEPGKLHCSQMRSLDEARFYLRHCPGVKMDGDNDGEPCEQQFGGF